MSSVHFKSRMLVSVSAQDTWSPLVVKGGIESVLDEIGEADAVTLEGFGPLAIGLHVLDFDLVMRTTESWTDAGREYDCEYEARDFRHRRPTLRELKLLHGPGEPVKRLHKLWDDVLCWSDALAAQAAPKLKPKLREPLYERYLRTALDGE